MIPTPRSTLDIPVIVDVVDVEIPAFTEQDVLDGNNPPVENAPSHLWNRIAINNGMLRFERQREDQTQKG